MAVVNRRSAWMGVATAVCLLLQLTVFTNLTVFGVHPDILLLLSLCVGIACGPNNGALMGFAAGLTHDVFLSSSLGLCALGYCLAGYAIGRLSNGAHELIWVTSALVAGGSAFALLIFLLLGGFINDVHVYIGHAIWIVVVITMINALAAPLFIRVIRRIWAIRPQAAW